MRRRDLTCYGMRSCNVEVDVGALEILLWEAAQAVRIRKRKLSKLRKFVTNNKKSGTKNERISLYRKAYDFPLGVE